MTKEQFELEFEIAVRNLYKCIQKSGVTLSFERIQKMMWEDLSQGKAGPYMKEVSAAFKQLLDSDQVAYCLEQPILVKPKR